MSLKYLGKLLALLLASLLTMPTFAQLKLDLPDTSQLPEMGNPDISAFSPINEAALGKQLYRSIRRSRPIIEDPELNTWIQSLGNRLALSSPHAAGQLYFAIENNPTINAHALLGGVIIINSGLILNTQSESELAAVMAHEIAHVSQHHIARMLKGNHNNPFLTGLGILAGAVVASQSDKPDVARAIITGTMALQAHNQIVFSHRAESEADRIGLRTLTAAHFDPAAMASFLEKLDRQQNNTYGDISKYLRSHPLTIERLSETRNLANQLRHSPVQEDSSYAFAREKLAQLTGERSNRLNSQAPAQLAQYKTALRAFQADQHDHVVQLLPNPGLSLPQNLLTAAALKQLGHYPEALQRLRALQSHYPQHQALNLLLAEALAGNRQAPQAIPLLLRFASQETTSTEFLEIAQRIAQQAGFAAEARLFNAERSIRLGQYEHAQTTLQGAVNLPSAAPLTAVLIRQRLNDLREMQTEKDRLTSSRTFPTR